MIACLKKNAFGLEKVQFKAGEVMLDIGCNIGLLSLIVAKAYPAIRVFSFDASPIAIECLQRAAALNEIHNIQTFQVALGVDRMKGVKFYSNGKESCLVEDALKAEGNQCEECSVNRISIDDIFDSPLLGIDRVRYLKMDIEGGEFAIFDHLFEKRVDILDRIDELHLEIHRIERLGPVQLSRKVREKFGDRAMLDI